MRSHDMCQSYQEYHSCLFNHMGDYDSLCAIVTTKTPTLSGRRISVWECDGGGRCTSSSCSGIWHRSVKRFLLFQMIVDIKHGEAVNDIL